MMKLHPLTLAATITLVTTTTIAALPVWALGFISGLGSVITAVGIAITVAGDHEDYVIDTIISSYQRDSSVTWRTGKYFKQKWNIYRTLSGDFTYVYTADDSGTKGTSYARFELGINGFPIASISYSCIQPEYSIIETSTVGFSSTYKIIKSAMYWWSIPQGTYFSIRLDGTTMSGYCGQPYGDPAVTAVSKYIMRNQTLNWVLEKKNLAVINWGAITQ